jgi:glycosyltransferase involved in cell wall biosynthesis
LKITLVNTWDTGGGAAIAATRLATALQKQGHQTHVLVDVKNTNNTHISVLGGVFYKYLQKIRFALDRLQFSFYEKNKAVRFSFSVAKIGVDVSENVHIKNADIVHLHWVNFGFLSMESLKKLSLLNKPIVVTLHDMWYFTGGCHYAGSCSNFHENCGNCTSFLAKPNSTDLSYKTWLQKADFYQNQNIYFVGCSQWMATMAKKSSLLKGKNIISIGNPIDTNLYKPTNKAATLDKLGLVQNKNYILFGAANIADVRKGFAYLKAALLLLPSITNTDSIELLVFGKSKSSDFEGIKLKVNVLGSITDQNKIIDYYNAAALFVSPSIEDNLPNTIMEAMACGTPVVAFGIGGIADMVVHKVNGYLAETKNSHSLAEGIANVLPKAVVYGDKARLKILDTFAEKHIADKYVQLYQNILLKQ